MAVQSFHRQLNTSDMACDVLPQLAADWVCRLPKSNSDTKLSHAALKELVASGQVKPADVVP
jgi:sterol 3beta-glucosyltransferase